VAGNTTSRDTVSLNERGSQCMSMTWRAISARYQALPWLSPPPPPPPPPRGSRCRELGVGSVFGALGGLGVLAGAGVLRSGSSGVLPTLFLFGGRPRPRCTTGVASPSSLPPPRA